MNLRDDSELVLPADSIIQTAPSIRVHWEDFDSDSFLEKGALEPGEDPYAGTNHNRTACEQIVFHRELPDMREPQLVLLVLSDEHTEV